MFELFLKRHFYIRSPVVCERGTGTGNERSEAATHPPSFASQPPSSAVPSWGKRKSERYLGKLGCCSHSQVNEPFHVSFTEDNSNSLREINSLLEDGHWDLLHFRNNSTKIHSSPLDPESFEEKAFLLLRK